MQCQLQNFLIQITLKPRNPHIRGAGGIISKTAARNGPDETPWGWMCFHILLFVHVVAPWVGVLKLFEKVKGIIIETHRSRVPVDRETVQPPKWSRPRNDPQVDPEMIPSFLVVNPEMIP